MPKIKSRRKGRTGVRGHQSSRSLTVAAPGLQHGTTDTSGTPGTATTRPRVLPEQSTRGLQSLIMSALVALGCWAFSYYTFLFYRDTNSYLFAGMAALLALVWSISFFVRLRKWRRR